VRTFFTFSRRPQGAARAADSAARRHSRQGSHAGVPQRRSAGPKVDPSKGAAETVSSVNSVSDGSFDAISPERIELGQLQRQESSRKAIMFRLCSVGVCDDHGYQQGHNPT
jgi:hypothetical protein